MASSVGVIFSSISEENVPDLTKVRSMGSIPYGGRYRLVDFALSNMVNSGITTVGMITKNNYQSLMDHLGSGKDWDLARKEGGLILLPPFSDESETLYKNRLEALRCATSFLNKCQQDFVILADSDAIYKMDYSKLVDFAIEKNADFVLAYKRGPLNKSSYYITLETNADQRVTAVNINPADDGNDADNYINVMVARRTFLLRVVRESIQRGLTSFGRDVLTRGVDTIRIFGYEFDGYYKNVNSMVAYFDANMDLLKSDVRDEIFGGRDVYTKVNDSIPAKFMPSSVVRNSLVSDGCFIEGTVINSILFRGVKIGKGTVVRNCILMTDTQVGDKVTLDYVITDKNSVIRDQRTLAGCEIQPYFINKGSMI
ncbi:MAG: glucose-1-phosphate adenylyltransferase subunit GlgD [Clostridia bacterium]|nr:glucose-1-phosphate adenylyltransferase subunit GlgD [Clostridia bacterium]